MRAAPPSICATRCKPPNPASAGSCTPATRSISHPTARRRRWPSGSLAAVNRLLASYGGAGASVPRLTAVINEKFAEMDLTIAMKRDYHDADALARVRTNRGKALMDEANVFFSGIISATDERLTTVVAEQKANATLLRLFSIISGIVIVIVIGTAAVTVVRYTRELRRARTEVSVLNAGLEQRVEARTADLQRANADIQRFVQIISHDLRAPLVSIVGFTAELEDSLGEPAPACRPLQCQAAAPTIRTCRKRAPRPPNCCPKRSDIFAPRATRWSG